MSGVAQFLHVSFNFKSEVNKDALKKQFDLALDWAHYMPNCWLLYTTSDPDTWYSRLKSLLSDQDHLFIVKIDKSVRNGWLPKWVWEWLNKQR